MGSSVREIQTHILLDLHAMGCDRDEARALGNQVLVQELTFRMAQHQELLTMSQNQRKADLRGFFIAGLVGFGIAGVLVLAAARGWI